MANAYSRTNRAGDQDRDYDCDYDWERAERELARDAVMLRRTVRRGMSASASRPYGDRPRRFTAYPDVEYRRTATTKRCVAAPAQQPSWRVTLTCGLATAVAVIGLFTVPHLRAGEPVESGVSHSLDSSLISTP